MKGKSCPSVIHFVAKSKSISLLRVLSSSPSRSRLLMPRQFACSARAMYFFGQLLQVLHAIGENNAIFVFQCSGDMPRDKVMRHGSETSSFINRVKSDALLRWGVLTISREGKTVEVLSRVTVYRMGPPLSMMTAVKPSRLKGAAVQSYQQRQGRAFIVR